MVYNYVILSVKTLIDGRILSGQLSVTCDVLIDRCLI